MLVPLISSWLWIENRSKILQSFPEHVQKVWYDWELQVMVLLSLFFQIILIFFGDRRKYIAGNKIGFIIWIAYLSADSVATFALGILSKTQGQQHTHTDELRALWAPFLLLHLGGPDTITAYALEDNELWLRHLLDLVIQASVAFYVVIRSWTGNGVSILTILMFVTGIIKYGERTLALRSASKEQFRDSMLSPPDPGPNYTKFMERYISKQREGFIVDIKKIKEAHSLHLSASRVGENITARDAEDEILLIKKAHDLFETFKRLFADLILSFRDGEESKKIIIQQSSSPEKVFKVLDIELGFMFDVLYTKAPIVYTRRGGLLRSLCLCLIISGFIFFTIVVEINPKHHKYYSNIDMVVTYLLLIVAIILEVYAVIILLSSDWVLFWLSKKHNKPSSMCVDVLLKRRLQCKKKNNRWSNSMGQNNLISFCLKDNNEGIKFIVELVKLSNVLEMLEMYRYTSFEVVPDKLKEMIFERLKRKLEPGGASTTNNNNDVKHLSTSGDYLQKLLGWSIVEVEFHHSILLWHIATDLCYNDQHHPNSPPPPPPPSPPLPDMCKVLSDYMLHLLIAHPFLLPEGIGQISYRDTNAETREFFKGKKSGGLAEENARKMLIEVNTEIKPDEVKGDRSKSVLFDACRLAKSLLLLDTKERWETMTTVWVDTLAYAASQCRGANHAKQLSQGGELLTHIWLLMAHLGITQQFQIAQGQVRAKLIFK